VTNPSHGNSPDVFQFLGVPHLSFDFFSRLLCVTGFFLFLLFGTFADIGDGMVDDADGVRDVFDLDVVDDDD
jgi:hypothetical protein